MKSALASAAIFAATALVASEYYSNITNQWYTGNQTNVYLEGIARLSTNENDIAGLLMKGSYDFVFAEPGVASNSMVRILEVARTVQSENFTNRVWVLELDNRSVFRHLGEETAEDLAADRIIAARPGKLPHYWRELDALDKDGYFAGPGTDGGEGEE